MLPTGCCTRVFPRDTSRVWFDTVQDSSTSTGCRQRGLGWVLEALLRSPMSISASPPFPTTGPQTRFQFTSKVLEPQDFRN